MNEFVWKRVNSRLQAVKSLPPQAFSGLPPPTRLDKRIPKHLFALAVTQDGREYKCVIQNVSAGGAGISMTDIAELPEEFLLAIDGYPAPAIVRLVWQQDTVGGVEFLNVAN